jgi:hypothetical protein
MRLSAHGAVADRLAAKSLDQQFVNEIIHGLNCSPFEAEAVLESVYRVLVISIEASGAQRLSAPNR